MSSGSALGVPWPIDISTRRARRVATSTLVALAIVVAGCLIVAWEARHSTFTADDWSWVLARRGWTAQAILSPHNEHLAALPIIAFKLLLAVFGLGSYLPFLALLIICHGIVCLSLYLLSRPYVGPWVALAPAAIVAVLGPAWHVLLFYASITFVGAVAAGLGMVLCLERRDRLGDVAAGVLLAVSLLTSSVGLAMVVFATVLIVLQRPTRWRRLQAVALPVALYLVWYAHYGVSTAKASNVTHTPLYVLRAASAAVASVTGLGQTHVSPYLVSTSYGRFVLVIAVGLLAFQLVRGLRPPPVAWAAMAALLALWIAEALAYIPNGREANQSRYQYAAAVLLLLIAASSAGGWRPGGRSGAILAVVTLLICAANVNVLHDRAGFWAANSDYARAETGALQVARGIARPDFAPEGLFNIAIMGDHNLTPITAGPYFSAIDEWGSSADKPRQILTRPEYARVAADLVVTTAEGVRPYPVPDRRPRGFSCHGGGAGSVPLQLPLSPGTRAVLTTDRQPVRLSLRRFASTYRFVRWQVPAGSAALLRLPIDRAEVAWHLRVLGGPGSAVCTSRA